MILAQYSRRPLDSFPGLTPNPSYPLPISHGINLFADPHPLNPVPSIFYKNMGGAISDFRLSPIPHYLSPFCSTTCTLFCSFLHLPKTQPICFQSITHSLRKTPGGRGGASCPCYP